MSKQRNLQKNNVQNQQLTDPLCPKSVTYRFINLIISLPEQLLSFNACILFSKLIYYTVETKLALNLKINFKNFLKLTLFY